MTVHTLSRGFDDEGKPMGTREVFINGARCLDNGKVVIGLGLAINPKPPVPTKDGEHLQAALLEPRTAKPRPLVLHAFARFVDWC